MGLQNNNMQLTPDNTNKEQTPAGGTTSHAPTAHSYTRTATTTTGHTAATAYTGAALAAALFTTTAWKAPHHTAGTTGPQVAPHEKIPPPAGSLFAWRYQTVATLGGAPHRGRWTTRTVDCRREPREVACAPLLAGEHLVNRRRNGASACALLACEGRSL